MHVILGCDHAGLELCAFLEKQLRSGHSLEVFKPAPKERVDYPDYATLVVQALLEKPSALGVLVCGSGIGMSIMANRFKGIRAALCTNAYMAKMARLHNDANVLCLGQNVVGFGVALSAIEAFLQTEFEGGRHAIRLDKIEGLKC
ncbi:ribose 5-phosphate isomerase B [Helicobacter ailurogastricus]|uniref:Ribose 5-phosphate isomerase B n=1 Tax=Helicobacter ailurogastricus TaxID=1578720 RepID=A0A0K2X5C9_9HELI|nr:ribose 5-phosphate isomerase B [Helicobacter ailurogastricus]CRF40728.1 Ribose 5-phosphate isomerase B [Helicobacter ailurogastricus]CRF43120.1 Ribose 5-phosphate isomerase B [Helicobacter ailurogastricus]CRF44349.1 Ribose 5-phosphate isomerase B [Helicobacter ailurogastricus]CRF52178.1 Ribose 5-phosphate isomerase B [Helicobacter ailurogastricus]BDQ29297.1 ribose 5-phosphate isomerase B [Helicobacter ailurogastricus]